MLSGTLVAFTMASSLSEVPTAWAWVVWGDFDDPNTLHLDVEAIVIVLVKLTFVACYTWNMLAAVILELAKLL